MVCGKGGDCYNRYLVRMGEMSESLNIIAAAIENLPGGSVNVELEDKLTIPDKNATYRSIEGLIQHFELFMWNRRWQDSRRRTLRRKRNGTRRTWLLPCGRWQRTGIPRTNPSAFVHPLCDVSTHDEGHQISDVPAILEA